MVGMDGAWEHRQAGSGITPQVQAGHATTCGGSCTWHWAPAEVLGKAPKGSAHSQHCPNRTQGTSSRSVFKEEGPFRSEPAANVRTQNTGISPEDNVWEASVEEATLPMPQHRGFHAHLC
jgi:hypothetical protein